MAKKTTVLVPIKREGEAGSVRAKIPAGLVSLIGGGEGDVIAIELHNTTIVGAKLLQGKEARLALKEKAAEAKEAAKSKAPKNPKKPVAPVKKSSSKKKTGKVSTSSDDEAPRISKGKKVKPAPKVSKKGSKRKTVVAYESEERPKKKLKLSLKKKKR